MGICRQAGSGMGLRVWVGEHKLHSRSALTAVFQPPANGSAVAVGTVPLRCADTVPRQLGTAAAAAAATAAGGRLLHSVTRRRRPPAPPQRHGRPQRRSAGVPVVAGGRRRHVGQLVVRRGRSVASGARRRRGGRSRARPPHRRHRHRATALLQRDGAAAARAQGLATARPRRRVILPAADRRAVRDLRRPRQLRAGRLARRPLPALPRRQRLLGRVRREEGGTADDAVLSVVRLPGAVHRRNGVAGAPVQLYRMQ